MDTETNSVVTVGFTTKVDHQTTSKTIMFFVDQFSWQLSNFHYFACRFSICTRTWCSSVSFGIQLYVTPSLLSWWLLTGVSGRCGCSARRSSASDDVVAGWWATDYCLATYHAQVGGRRDRCGLFQQNWNVDIVHHWPWEFELRCILIFAKTWAM